MAVIEQKCARCFTVACLAQLWTQVASQQFLVWADFSQSSDGDPAQRVLDPGSPLTVHIRRTRFTERYAVVVVVLMWFIAGFNFMHCMDNGEL